MGRQKKLLNDESADSSKEPLEKEKRVHFDIASEAKRGISAIFLFVVAILMLLGFFGKAGVVGSTLDNGVGVIIGLAKLIFPIFLILAGVILFFRKKTSFYVFKIIGLGLMLMSVTGFLHWFNDVDKMLPAAKAGEGGGYIGYLAAFVLTKYLGNIGGMVVIVAIFFCGLILAFNFSILNLLEKLKAKEKKETEFVGEENKKTEEEARSGEVIVPVEPPKNKADENIRNIKFVEGPDQFVDDKLLQQMSNSGSKKNLKNGFKISRLEGSEEEIGNGWEFPPTKLLEKSSGGAKGGNTDQNEEIIEKTFHHFGIEVVRAGHQVGPAVTQYRFRPAVGVKVAQILGLHNDIALALAKHPIRIEAPIPGQSLIGIEVPNDAPAMVCLRDFVESEDFLRRKSNLTLALGEDVSGTHIFTDLGKMPHLMIAGSTGTGKSVSINSIITTLLYQNSPKDLRFIMVDPKRVELTMYAGIPHLLTPVITDNVKVVNALRWVVGEMERRFRLLQDMGSQNIISYHDKIAKERAKKYTDPETGEIVEEEHEKLPYVVVVIDELAELIMSHGKEAENVIVRIAQLGRAAGIHLIISTQRPEVKIITGLIKANINARIAFKVNTQIDSRTILDMGGAEKLLGNGDMLYVSASAPKPKRIQGVFISEAEVKRVVKFIKSQKFEDGQRHEITGKEEPASSDSRNETLGGELDAFLAGNNEQEDSMYAAAKEEVIRAKKASASLLQRRLRVGYARAARILDELETNGVIGPADGSKPREVFESSEAPAYENPMEDQAKRDKWQM